MKPFLFHFLISWLIIILPASSIAQMSGTYTVGHINDSFPTLDSALTTLSSFGMTGDVELMISDGFYNSMVLNSFVPQAPFTLTIGSATENPHNVVFGQAGFYNSENITIRNIGFIKQHANYHYSAVSIDGCHNFRLVSCRIIDSVNTLFNYDASALILNCPYNSKPMNVYIDSTFIMGLSGIPPYQDPCKTIYLTGSSSCHYVFREDSILGNWHSMGGQFKRDFYNCFIKNTRLDYYGNNIADSCTIVMVDENSLRTIRFNHLTNSTLNCYRTKLDILSMSGCTLNGSVQTSHVYNTTISGNYFNGRASFAFPYGTTFRNNIFNGYTSFSQHNNALILNNFFLDTVSFGNGDGKLIHNNFGPAGVLLNPGGSGGSIINNNINVFLGYYDLPYIRNNNYFSKDELTYQVTLFDPFASFYDPMYNSPVDLRVNNPALFSRAEFLSVVTDDFDGDLRNYHRTIGADEGCLSMPFPDTIYVECNTMFALETCDDSLFAGLVWKPGPVFIDSSQVRPQLLVDTEVVVWLEDSLGMRHDSIRLIPRQHEYLGTRNQAGYCWANNRLATYVPKNGTVSWEPVWAVDNPDSNVVFVKSYSDITLIATITSICGIGYDTINLQVNPVPNTYFWPDSLGCAYAYFKPSWDCYDSLLWDFGDGTFSTDVAVMHHFPTTGYFWVTLSMWHKGYYNSMPLEILISCDDIPEPLQEPSSLTIFPNPAMNRISILLPEDHENQYDKIDIFDLSGKLILTAPANYPDNIITVDIDHLQNGVYIVTYGPNRKLFVKSGTPN